MDGHHGDSGTTAPSGGAAASWGRSLACLLAFAALALVIYGPALHGGFVWDDADWTTRVDATSRGLDGLWTLWSHPLALQQYYPLTGTTFWIDRHLWGLDTLPYHVENVLLHALTAFLFVRLLRRLSVKGAELAGLIFLLHPVMVESVAWITERKNVLSSACLMGSLLLNARIHHGWAADAGPAEPGRRLRATAFLLFLAALLAKATAVVMPVAVLLLAWWKRGSLEWRRDVRPVLPYFVSAIICSAGIAWLEKHHVGAEGQDFDLTLAQRIIAAGRSLGFYPWKLLWPLDTCFVYPRPDLSPSQVSHWLWPLASAAVLLAAWFLRRRAGRGLVTGLLIYVAAIFPVLGILNAYGMKFALTWDHWAYLPSLALIALAAHGLVALSERLRRSALPWAFAVLTLPPAGILAWNSATRFQNERTLWETTIRQNPDAWLARYDLAQLLERSGENDEARAQYERCIALAPEHAEFHNNLANLLLLKGDVRGAETQYHEAVKIHPEYARLRINLGNILALQHRTAEAVAQFRKAAELEPSSAEFERRLGTALADAGHPDAALDHFSKAVSLDPGSAEAHYYYGTSLLKHARLDEAVEQFEAAIRIDPAMANAHYNLGNARIRMKRADLAEPAYRKAVELNPRDAEYENNLGWALQKTGRPSQAMRHYETALRLDANLALAHKNLAWILATSPDASQRDAASALEHARRAVELTSHADPLCLLALGAACAESGQFADAETAAQEALKLAQDQQNTALTSALEEQIRLYQSRQPTRDPSLATPGTAG